MAIENRGGPRPTAPQNNVGISHNGGAGSKAGQPNRLATGGEWGSRKSMAIQQGGAPMKDASSPIMPMPTPLTAPSELPDQSIMDGSPIGGGSNILNIATQRDNSGFNASIEEYAPVLNFIASRETTSVETRNAIAGLLRGNKPQ